MLSKEVGFNFRNGRPKVQCGIWWWWNPRDFWGYTFHSLQRSKFAASIEGNYARTSPTPFQRYDIMWLPHITSGHGLYTNAKIAVIPWDCLKDFIEGEQNNPNFPCKFIRTKDHVRSSAPNTLMHLEQILQHLFIGETSYKVTFT